MANITVTTNQQVIEVTESGGVDVTNTTNEITVLTSGTLIIEGAAGSITSVNGQTGPIVVLDTDDILEGTNKYFSQALARGSLSAGTGINYNTGTGVITNTSINTDTTYTIASAATTGGANLNLVGSDSTTDSVAYKGAGATTVTSTDANTVTITSTDTNTTYTQNASAVSGGANLNLVGSDSTTDSIKLASGTNVTVTRTDADTVTISSTDTNTTYTIASGATSGGANLTLTGSDSSTDNVAYLGSGATTVTSTDANTITISSTDTNTTYTQNISSTTGGANLNLVGSDATTDTVKFASGTGVTVAFTDADTATISIGQSVGTGDSPSFAGGTFGNITVGVSTDNTIASTDTNGNITLAPNGTGDVVLTLADSGNLTNSRNYVAGAIRNTFAEAAGNIFSFSTTAAGGPTQGISIDNSINTTKRPGVVIRSYGGGLASGNPVGYLITETSRGSAATPTGLSSGNGLGSWLAGGYADTSVSGTGPGWVSDTTGNTVGSFSFATTEAWTGGTGANSPLGTRVRISTNPTGSANAVQTSLEINPQSTLHRSDAFTWSQGKTGTTQTMALDVNGNLTVTGDLTVTGNDIKSSGGTTAISLSGANVIGAGNISTTVGSINANGAFDSNEALSATANLLDTNTLAGSSVGITTKYWTSSAKTTLSVPQNTNKLGNLRFNSYSDTAGTFAIGSQVSVEATENWTSTANGSRVIFFANKQGQNWTTGQLAVISAAPESASISSNIITLENSAGNDYLVLNGSTATLKNTAGNPLTGNNISYGRQYIEAYSTQDQTNPVANAENLMSFNNTGISNGISVVTNGTTLTRITMSNAGVYNIQFSAQLNQTSGGAHNAFIWLKKNGANVADSAGDTRIAGNGDRIMAAWNYIVSASAGDYYELAWASDGTAVVLDYVAAAGVVPAIPSVILTVVPVGA